MSNKTLSKLKRVASGMISKSLTFAMWCALFRIIVLRRWQKERRDSRRQCAGDTYYLHRECNSGKGALH